MDYSMTNPGTQFWWNAPRSPVGQDPRVAEDVEAKYQQASWGHVALGLAGGLIMGLLIGHIAGRRSAEKRRYRANRYHANARWSRRYKNQLPDSHFFYVEPGGRKVRQKRGTFTIPKSKRKLPYRDLQGRVDAAHVRNAISRAGQKKTRIPETEKRRIQGRARRLLGETPARRRLAA